MEGSIVILDFGGQYAHLIANRVRRLGAYSEIRVAETPAKELQGAAGIILSGGPQSVYEPGSPQADPGIFDLGIPILGLCYGHQWLAHALGGKVEPGKTKEYGRALVEIVHHGHLFKNVPKTFNAWMSHGDEVTRLPEGFTHTVKSAHCTFTGMADEKRRIYGVQFHLEVTHTEHGMEILQNFVSLCESKTWSIENFTDHVSAQIQKEVGKKNVFMLVSGGVDSTVAFTLLNRVLGASRVQGLLVDTGLMRKNEVPMIREAFQRLGIDNLHIEDASDRFFTALKGVYDPEEKRKIIGNTFLEVQADVSARMGLADEKNWLLGQGTIYPDTIETGGTKHADHIKTHHNRVEMIQKLIEKGLVIEPLKELYKDEVRMLGEELGLPHELVWRHPFPGPGLGVRILCAEKPEDVSHIQVHLPVSYAVLPIKSVGVQGDNRTYRHAIALFADRSCHIREDHLHQATLLPNTNPHINRVLLCTSRTDVPAFTFTPGTLTRERADLLHEADAIVNAEVDSAGLHGEIWQFPVVLLPFGTKKGGQSIVLRPIVSTDAMTASPMVIPEHVLQSITEKLRALNGIDLVFIDLTSKPPGTIEWE